MGFAVPKWENRLSALSADNSYPCVNASAGAFMVGYFWVAIGGALGSVARYWFSDVVARRFGETFPWGTILVNITGSFVIGFFATLTAPDGRWLVPAWFRQQFFMLGICGGYTTFSSFSLQTLNLLEDGEWLYAGANVLISVICCLVAVWLGHVAATGLNASPR
jgi:CrcB protein